jgi:hypothetical protein
MPVALHKLHYLKVQWPVKHLDRRVMGTRVEDIIYEELFDQNRSVNIVGIVK